MVPKTFKNPNRNRRFGAQNGPKPNETNPKMPGAVPANRLKPIPIVFGPVSVWFDHDPKLLNCEIAQPRKDMDHDPCVCPSKSALRPADGRPEGRF